MAFADPQTVTINAVAQTLPRVGISDTRGVFRKDDASVQLQFTATSNGKRDRNAVRIDHKKVAADPLMPSTNALFSMSVTLVVDTPVAGYTLAEKKQIADALVAYLTASSGARVTQLLGGEL
jgi:hypothetical protein